LPFPLAWWLIAHKDFTQRWFAFWAAVGMMVALVYSLSRGGLLALGVQLALLFVYLWSERKQDARRMQSQHTPLLVGVALSVSLLLAFALAYDQLAARFELLQQGAQEYSLVTRRAFWTDSWKLFLAHPLTGAGLGAFPTAYPQFGRSSAQNERLETVHNDYLQVLTDAGLVGAALLAWFLYELWRQARSVRRQWDSMRSSDRALCLGGWLALAGIAVHSVLDFNLQITANALLCLLALSLVVTAGESKHSNHESDSVSVARP
jgi:O-antigen ligase